MLAPLWALARARHTAWLKTFSFINFSAISVCSDFSPGRQINSVTPLPTQPSWRSNYVKILYSKPAWKAKQVPGGPPFPPVSCLFILPHICDSYPQLGETGTRVELYWVKQQYSWGQLLGFLHCTNALTAFVWQDYEVFLLSLIFLLE